MRYKDKFKEQQILLLKKFYTLDGNRATVELYFDTFEELIDNNLGNYGVEKLNGIIIEKLKEAFSVIPKKCEIAIKIFIKDFGNYKEAECVEIIKDNIQLYVYTLVIENFRRRKASVALMLTGIVLLLASYLLGNLEMPQIIYDIINISGSLCIWETAYINVIENGQNLKSARQFIKKIKDVTVRKNNH